ncbi:intraflagellar transport protein 46 homolog isoform X1 [Daphnia magna]|uniref:Intraflagellar transport protein 46 homolog n=1 Tax=Daphnia magna TaxID=35525 RepID=A0A4Y7MFD6_9CRUS|nr:intraflagellar transport protein 46 homolog isoform X1 [Daphnia magna]SVE80440.1 EOG090X0FP3 [Daphnia magna]
MAEIESHVEEKKVEEDQEMEEWSDAEDPPQKKTETDFMFQDLRADSDTLTETFNEEIFHAKDEPEMDTSQHEEEMDESIANLYDPIEFNGVNVPFQIRELFHFITKYRPQILEMETKLKPFLPDFIPAVGDPDAFLKIDRPDENTEFLGLTLIDEPSLNQSDPSVLDLRLRSIYKQSSAKKTVARTIEEGNKVKAIEKWIKDINELHRSKPLPTVNYNKPLPDIDALLQEWNPDVEDILSEDKILPSNLNCDLNFYTDVACVYLRTKPEVAHERMAKRQRPEEKEIPLSYIHLVHDCYETWLVGDGQAKAQSLAPVLILDANRPLDEIFKVCEENRDKILGIHR